MPLVQPKARSHALSPARNGSRVSFKSLSCDCCFFSARNALPSSRVCTTLGRRLKTPVDPLVEFLRQVEIHADWVPLLQEIVNPPIMSFPSGFGHSVPFCAPAQEGHGWTAGGFGKALFCYLASHATPCLALPRLYATWRQQRCREDLALACSRKIACNWIALKGVPCIALLQAVTGKEGEKLWELGRRTDKTSPESTP